MAMKCSICHRRDRRRIDKAVIEGVPLRNIALQAGTTAPTLIRHRRHISQALAQASELRESEQARELRRTLDRVKLVAWKLVAQARRAGDVRGAALGLRAVLHAADLEGRCIGAFANNTGRSNNVMVVIAPMKEHLAIDHVVNVMSPENGEGDG